jgi:outer membrane protein OmpA-like peptidoglycan-associated protein
LADELRPTGLERSIAAPSDAPDSRLALAPALRLPADTPPPVRETPRGIVLTLPEAYFAYGRAELEPRARLAVERMVRVLSRPGALGRRVIVEGHTDDIGGTRFNLTLSRRRAETVARELIAQGIRRDRVSVKALGETRPAAPNRHADGSDNPSGRAKNRRVEAVVRN